MANSLDCISQGMLLQNRTKLLYDASTSVLLLDLLEMDPINESF